MNLFLVILVIALSLWRGDWRNWEDYYPTMLYVSLATFLYEFISHSHYHLWELRKDSVFNLMNVHFTHNLIINPFIAFIFLSHYPNGMKKQLIYLLKWILSFVVLEWLAEWLGVLSYHNGWHLGWSFLFVIIMFPMIRLHHVHKLRALVLSVFFAVFYLAVFDYI